MRSITEQIQELRAMPVADLVERYEELHGRPPRNRNHSWLWRRCAWRIQADRYGGLSQVARRRIDELIGELDLPLGNGRTVRSEVPRSTEPLVGTTLTRVFKGREIRATAVEGGWECGGVVHGSLSAVARAVTGSRWNGRLFFGLSERSAKR
jgi:hypothetical protein